MSGSASSLHGQPLWEPTVVLPSQYFDHCRLQSPEAALMSAVLEDAFVCVARNVGARDGRRCRELREAHEWFSSQRRDWPFAFLQVCDTLGLDIDAIRQRVALLVAEHQFVTAVPVPRPLIVERPERVAAVMLQASR